MTTPDGRFTAVMPHPERTRNVQMSWTSGDKSAFSPWMQIWRNARRFIGWDKAQEMRSAPRIGEEPSNRGWSTLAAPRRGSWYFLQLLPLLVTCNSLLQALAVAPEDVVHAEIVLSPQRIAKGDQCVHDSPRCDARSSKNNR